MVFRLAYKSQKYAISPDVNPSTSKFKQLFIFGKSFAFSLAKINQRNIIFSLNDVTSIQLLTPISLMRWIPDGVYKQIDNLRLGFYFQRQFSSEFYINTPTLLTENSTKEIKARTLSV